MPNVLIINTYPRTVPYLIKTLLSLYLQGAQAIKPRIVFHDGGNIPTTPDDLGYHHIGESATNRGNTLCFWDALAFIVRWYPGHDLMWFEDDVESCLNGVTAAAEFPIPDDVEFLTFFQMSLPRYPRNSDYRAYERIKRSPPSGIYRLHLTNHFGQAQALRFPWRTVELLHRLGPPPREVIENFTSRFNGIDQSIGHQLSGKVAAYVHPPFFQHIGDVSAACPERNGRNLLRSPWYRRDYDALTRHTIPNPQGTTE